MTTMERPDGAVKADTIRITDEASRKAAEILLDQSALGFCATLVGGNVVSIRPVQTLSSGERVLWEALTDMSLGIRPYDEDLDVLDAPNRDVLIRATLAWDTSRVPSLKRLWEAVAEGNPTALALLGLGD